MKSWTIIVLMPNIRIHRTAVFRDGHFFHLVSIIFSGPALNTDNFKLIPH